MNHILKIKPNLDLSLSKSKQNSTLEVSDKHTLHVSSMAFCQQTAEHNTHNMNSISKLRKPAQIK